ncbi:MAG: amino acid permease [Bacteroidota bacterium]
MPSDLPTLKKNLTLFDVYAISTGAMFSSGFFLLPGLATAKAGPATVLAYAIAGVLILPAMFSQAELSTAMPRAGGTYYFLDRSLGPLAGTVGGLGTWLALVLKSAFALIGMGAYLVFFFDVPIKPLAVALTLAFAVLNVIGAKETSGLQRLLVAVLVAVLAFFVVQGLFEIYDLGVVTVTETQFVPFMPFGTDGLLATVGLVFVSYAGLTKVASVAEEVQNPDRNIPLGMVLSLATAMFFYIGGVYIMIAVLDPAELRGDLTPVATAAELFFDWLPSSWGLFLIVVAAIAAFASTGNAGILSASRYPLAMARDRLVTHHLAYLGRFGTPTLAVLVTAGLIIMAIVALDVVGVAKLASAFQLLIFALVNLAVVVMRESHIPSYVPGYRSPFYPWMQIVGILTPFVLIAQMGALAISLTVVTVAAGVLWYVYYVRPNTRVVREGAIYHLFERLGRRRYDGLDSELRGILKEKGLRDEASFEDLVARAAVLDLDESCTFEDITHRVSSRLAEELPLTREVLAEGFLDGSRYGITPVSNGACLPHQRLASVSTSHLVLVRSRPGLFLPDADHSPAAVMADERMHAFFFLISPEDPPGQHLRTLASLASRIDEGHFMQDWLEAAHAHDLKELLLRHDRYFTLQLSDTDETARLLGQPLKALGLPAGTLVAFIRREGHLIIPSGSTVLHGGDRVTIIGDEAPIRQLYATYHGAPQGAPATP